jgi:hypothetical protein
MLYLISTEVPGVDKSMQTIEIVFIDPQTDCSNKDARYCVFCVVTVIGQLRRRLSAMGGKKRAELEVGKGYLDSQTACRGGREGQG